MTTNETVYSVGPEDDDEARLAQEEMRMEAEMMEDEDTPLLAYNRRYVVVNEREILDTRYASILDLAQGKLNQEELAYRLILTRYPSPQAAREAEVSLNQHDEGGPMFKEE